MFHTWGYDSDEEGVFTIYLDPNKLYGWAMIHHTVDLNG